MSLRQAFKSKFRQEKSEMDIMTAPTILQTYPSEEHLLEEIGDECPHPDKDCNEDSCSACYKSQFAQLQEQLVSIMLENQQLVDEIKELKSNSIADQLFKQLEKEREKSRMLTEKLHEKESGTLSSKSPRLRRFVRKEKHSSDKGKLTDIGEASGMCVIVEKEDIIDICKDTEEEKDMIHTETTPIQSEGAPFPVAEKPTTWRGCFKAWIASYFSDVIEDFTETNIEDEDSGEDDPEGDALTVRKLKDNLVRFTNATKPVSNLFEGIVSLLRWNSPGTTMLAFCVYMYTVYHGWLLPLFLFLFICQLTLNYIKGWFCAPHITRKPEHDVILALILLEQKHERFPLFF